MAPSTDDMTDSDHNDPTATDADSTVSGSTGASATDSGAADSGDSTDAGSTEAGEREPGSPYGDPLAPPAAPSRPPLRRATTNKEWLGVAEGLSRYLGVAAGFVRLVFVVTTFFGGLGLIIYLLAAALVPKEGEANALGDRLTGGRSELLLVLIGALALAIVGIVNDGDSDLALVGILIIGGFALWAQSNGRLNASTLARGDGQPLAPPTSTYAPWTAVQPSVPLPAYPPKPRKSPRLGLATLAAATVAMIVLAPWSSVWRVVSVGFVILAVGLVAGWIFRKRVWFLLLPLIALTPVLPAAAFYSRSGVPLNAGTGSVTLATDDLAGASTTRRLSAGHITIDVSELNENRSITAAVGAGQIDVIVPRNARIVVRGRSGVGIVRVLGSDTEGTDVEVDRTIAGSEGAITITIDARVGMGLVAVRRSGDQS
jgi:phage shock protein PspC (stress-responsive transcriptional regulator)